VASGVEEVGVEEAGCRCGVDGAFFIFIFFNLVDRWVLVHLGKLAMSTLTSGSLELTSEPSALTGGSH
jgi:hypothetical protein